MGHHHRCRCAALGGLGLPPGHAEDVVDVPVGVDGGVEGQVGPGPQGAVDLARTGTGCPRRPGRARQRWRRRRRWRTRARRPPRRPPRPCRPRGPSGGLRTARLRSTAARRWPARRPFRSSVSVPAVGVGCTWCRCTSWGRPVTRLRPGGRAAFWVRPGARPAGRLPRMAALDLVLDDGPVLVDGPLAGCRRGTGGAAGLAERRVGVVRQVPTMPAADTGSATVAVASMTSPPCGVRRRRLLPPTAVAGVQGGDPDESDDANDDEDLLLAVSPDAR